jgi:hypothetical protein
VMAALLSETKDILFHLFRSGVKCIVDLGLEVNIIMGAINALL